MFVAGFIGSPQMNFIDANLTEKSGNVFVNFAGFSIKLPEDKASVPGLKEHIGKDVVLGIRPENIHNEDMYLTSMADSIVNADVEVTELMGAETYLYLDIEGNKITARVKPTTSLKSGDKIKVAFDTTKVMLFDKETELAIVN
jgi:multiple sugar transport system ATP-binding protein